MWSLALPCLEQTTAGQLLFRDETQRTKFAKWDAKKEGATYLRWATDLSRDEESVLVGVSFTFTALRPHLAAAAES